MWCGRFIRLDGRGGSKKRWIVTWKNKEVWNAGRESEMREWESVSCKFILACFRNWHNTHSSEVEAGTRVKRALYKFAVRKPLHKFDLIECTVRGNMLFVENDVIEYDAKSGKIALWNTTKWCVAHSKSNVKQSTQYISSRSIMRKAKAKLGRKHIKQCYSQWGIGRLTSRWFDARGKSFKHSQQVAGLSDSTFLPLDAAIVRSSHTQCVSLYHTYAMGAQA